MMQIKSIKALALVWLLTLLGCTLETEKTGNLQETATEKAEIFTEENINIRNIEEYEAFDSHVIAVEVEGIHLHYQAQRRRIDEYYAYLVSEEKKTLEEVLSEIFPVVYEQLLRIVPADRDFWKMEARDFQGLVVLPDDSIRGIYLVGVAGGDSYHASERQMEVRQRLNDEKESARVVYSAAFPEMYQHMKLYQPAFFEAKFLED